MGGLKDESRTWRVLGGFDNGSVWVGTVFKTRNDDADEANDLRLVWNWGRRADSEEVEDII